MMCILNEGIYGKIHKCEIDNLNPLDFKIVQNYRSVFLNVI